MHSNSRITQHSLRPRRRNHNLLPSTSLDRIRKASDHPKLEPFLFVVPRDVEQRSARELLLLDFEVGECRVELDTPVYEAVCAVDDSVFVQSAECFRDGSGEVLLECK
jgi:hypothetical protein